MAKLDDLSRIRKNVEDSVQDDWAAFKKNWPQKKSNAVQNCATGLVDDFRIRAILGYLLDGDRAGFFQSSFQAAMMYEFFCSCCYYGMPCDEEDYSLTERRGFFDALLTTTGDDLKRIMSVVPSKKRSQESPVHVVLAGFLKNYAIGNKEKQQRALELLPELQADGFEAALELRLCEGFFEKDSKKLKAAIENWANVRQAQIKVRDDVSVGEEFVYVEALALRRLAYESGMSFILDHPLVPKDLQGDYPPVASLERGDVPVFPDEMCSADAWKGWSPIPMY